MSFIIIFSAKFETFFSYIMFMGYYPSYKSKPSEFAFMEYFSFAIADLILEMISAYICCSGTSFLDLVCFFIRELNLFLMECSLRTFPKIFTILAHFLPCCCTYSNINRHYSLRHMPLILEGSRWLFHLSRHCLGVLKYFLLDIWNKDFET